MSNNRKNPSYKLKLRLLQEVKFQCPFCLLTDVTILEHHHIDGNALNSIFENLISVCPNCHSKIEAGLINFESVIEIKNHLSKGHEYFFNNQYKFDNFRIHDDRVGIFKRGMTIREVFMVLPSNQIRKTITYGEHDGEDLYDSYEIYDSNGEHILSLETAEHGNVNFPIQMITILSEKFHTLTGIKIGAKIADIRQNELIEKYEPDINHIHFQISWCNISCSVKKSELIEEWWDESNEKVYITDKNLEARIELITVHWNE